MTVKYIIMSSVSFFRIVDVYVLAFTVFSLYLECSFLCQ